ncbi:glycosyltransferase [Tundrisphaera sp. TA3]|uniref:glycosyltransferase n=1 Tax=Tundrisphaera sp. TA3 TaxID=3435775 RepID=UPI003EBC2E21
MPELDPPGPPEHASLDRAEARRPALLVIPTFNDWESLAGLLPMLDEALAAGGYAADVLIVDDGSTEPLRPDFARGPYRALKRVDALPLRRNLGHQRAIAIGFAYAEDRLDHEAIVVMDADGEDAPADVPRLLDCLRAKGGREIVFAERTRRSEDIVFRTFYGVYRFVHRYLTGYAVRVGNFSAVPRSRLESLVVVDEMWNHYAAAVFRSRQPYCSIPTHRAHRLRGRSKMNFIGLVVHGLSAISVYGEIVGVRLLMLVIAMGGLAAAGLVATVAIRLTTSLAIPGWATTAAGLSLMLLMQAMMLAFVLCAVILGARRGTSFVPRKDYAIYIREPVRLDRPAASEESQA